MDDIYYEKEICYVPRSLNVSLLSMIRPLRVGGAGIVSLSRVLGQGSSLFRSHLRTLRKEGGPQKMKEKKEKIYLLGLKRTTKELVEWRE
jgi:hypothetical protein